MKALLCENWGPIDQLAVKAIEPPKPAAGEMIIDVKAVGLNFLDTLIIEKKYQFQPDLPFSPGAEIAGIVASVGDHVDEFQPGDRIMAFLDYGGARQQVAITPQKAVPLPPAVSFETAAGFMITYATGLYAFRNQAKLKPGETVAILGASGGVGQAAIEIAKLMGARVIACASSPEKLEFCKQLGADELVDYSKTDLKLELKRLTDGKGVDVVYDAVGGDYAEQALRATGWRGRYLVVGFAAGKIPKMPLNLVLLKGCDIISVYWGEHVRREPQAHLTNMATLVNWWAKGDIAPHIYKTWPLDQAKQALHAIARREVKGKAILVL